MRRWVGVAASADMAGSAGRGRCSLAIPRSAMGDAGWNGASLVRCVKSPLEVRVRTGRGASGRLGRSAIAPGVVRTVASGGARSHQAGCVHAPREERAGCLRPDRPPVQAHRRTPSAPRPEPCRPGRGGDGVPGPSRSPGNGPREVRAWSWLHACATPAADRVELRCLSDGAVLPRACSCSRARRASGASRARLASHGIPETKLDPSRTAMNRHACLEWRPRTRQRTQMAERKHGEPAPATCHNVRASTG